MYEGIRLLPCVSTPRRSAATRHFEIMEAWSSGVPFLIRIEVMKALRSSWLIRCMFCCSVILVIVLILFLKLLLVLVAL